MTGYDQCEWPDFYRETFHVARVQHDCCECGKTINRGDRYFKATGKWDGDVRVFKTCMDCMNIRIELSDHGENPDFGGLLECHADWMEQQR